MRDESRPALSVVSSNGAHPDVPKIPTNLAVKCPNCRELLVGKDWEKNLRVCHRCDHHFRLAAPERTALLLDPESFEPFATDLPPNDPLGFVSRSQAYATKLEAERHILQKDRYRSVVVRPGMRKRTSTWSGHRVVLTWRGG